LIRLVRRQDGIEIDATGKLSGRGAYLHDQRSCWESGLNGALAHALRMEIGPEDRERLMKFMETLPSAGNSQEAADM
jgi:predicted RNA-binding protein YlxR (DUF448 family)